MAFGVSCVATVFHTMSVGSNSRNLHKCTVVLRSCWDQCWVHRAPGCEGERSVALLRPGTGLLSPAFVHLGLL